MSKTLEINKLEGNNPEASTAPILDSLDYRDYEDPDSRCECGEILPESEYDYTSKEFTTTCNYCGNTYTSRV